MRDIQLALARAGCILFRNNVGQYQYSPGKYIRYGICNPGGSDLIGWYRGRFLAVEVKTHTGKLTDPQRRFLEVVNGHGGIAFVARSVSEAMEELRERLSRGNTSGLQGLGSGAPEQSPRVSP